MSPFLSAEKSLEVDLTESNRTFKHRFRRDDIQAINVAVAAGRPLLLRGDPGVGKSQLARAAAKARGAAFVSMALHARTESDDLIYTFDAVARLAEAQVMGALGVKAESDIAAKLDETRVLEPGILWWAFDWGSASKQVQRSARGLKTSGASKRKASSPAVAGCPFQIDDGDPAKGVVVLLDEIDKAESSVPNGLLEALGHRRLHVPWHGEVNPTGVPMLVCITTNEERSLPDAFVRRCMVHRMEMPKREELLKRAEAHAEGRCTSSVLEALVEQLEGAIEVATGETGVRPPGQAELLDAVRALSELAPHDDVQQKTWLETIGRIAFEKHKRS